MDLDWICGFFLVCIDTSQPVPNSHAARRQDLQYIDCRYQKNGFDINTAKLGTQIKRILLATTDSLAGLSP